MAETINRAIKEFESLRQTDPSSYGMPVFVVGVCHLLSAEGETIPTFLLRVQPRRRKSQINIKKIIDTEHYLKILNIRVGVVIISPARIFTILNIIIESLNRYFFQ